MMMMVMIIMFSLSSSAYPVGGWEATNTNSTLAVNRHILLLVRLLYVVFLDHISILYSTYYLCSLFYYIIPSPCHVVCNLFAIYVM